MKLNLSDAPTFRPSPEEFKDPFAYISAIREQAESYGICKVGTPKPSSTEFWYPTCHRMRPGKQREGPRGPLCLIGAHGIIRCHRNTFHHWCICLRLGIVWL